MPRKIPVGDSYFREIDTEEKAYFLGFMLADGAVVRNSVRLEVSSKDIDIIEKFKQAVRSEHRIINDGRSAKIAFNSMPMVADLASLGIVARKSLVASPPSVDPLLSRHFWRGMIDGDGHITVGRARRLGLCGTSAVCEGFADLCRSIIGLRPSVYPTSMIHGVVVCGDSAVAVGRHLYDGATVFLDRKMQAYRDLGAFKPSRAKASQFVGVRRTRYGWSAVAGSHYIGHFKAEVDAARAYDAYVITNGLRKRINFLEGI